MCGLEMTINFGVEKPYQVSHIIWSVVVDENTISIEQESNKWVQPLEHFMNRGTGKQRVVLEICAFWQKNFLCFHVILHLYRPVNHAKSLFCIKIMCLPNFSEKSDKVCIR